MSEENVEKDFFAVFFEIHFLSAVLSLITERFLGLFYTMFLFIIYIHFFAGLVYFFDIHSTGVTSAILGELHKIFVHKGDDLLNLPFTTGNPD